MIVRLIIFSILFGVQSVEAKKVKYRDKQEVSFDESSIDGVARNPDGAYLMQKRGMKFMPLYKVRKKFDDEIKSSVDFLR